MSDAEREELILKHIPLLKHIVGRVAMDLPSSVDRDDLYGFGMLGLIAAIPAIVFVFIGDSSAFRKSQPKCDRLRRLCVKNEEKMSDRDKN